MAWTFFHGANGASESLSDFLFCVFLRFLCDLACTQPFAPPTLTPPVYNSPYKTGRRVPLSPLTP